MKKSEEAFFVFGAATPTIRERSDVRENRELAHMRAELIMRFAAQGHASHRDPSDAPRLLFFERVQEANRGYAPAKRRAGALTRAS